MADRGDRGRWTAAFLLIALTWGLNYLFVRAGLAVAAPLWLAFLRASVGAVTVGLFLLVRPASARRLDPRGRRDALLLGLPNTALFFGLWFLVAGTIPPGETAVLVYTFPLWVALLGGFLSGRSLGTLQWLAIAGGFLGEILISLPEDGPVTALPVGSVVALLIGAFSWAIGTVFIQRRFHRDQLQEVNGYQLAGGSLGLLAASLVLEPGGVPAPAVPLLLIVLWLGVLGTAGAYAGWFYLLGRIPAPTLSTFTFVVPLVALAASSVFFGERLDLVQAVGVGLVVLSIYVVGRSLSRPPGPGATAPPAAAETPGARGV